jgi:hypothetical protein
VEVQTILSELDRLHHDTLYQKISQAHPHAWTGIWICFLGVVTFAIAAVGYIYYSGRFCKLGCPNGRKNPSSPTARGIERHTVVTHSIEPTTTLTSVNEHSNQDTPMSGTVKYTRRRSTSMTIVVEDYEDY